MRRKWTSLLIAVLMLVAIPASGSSVLAKTISEHVTAQTTYVPQTYHADRNTMTSFFLYPGESIVFDVEQEPIGNVEYHGFYNENDLGLSPLPVEEIEQASTRVVKQRPKGDSAGGETVDVYIYTTVAVPANSQYAYLITSSSGGGLTLVGTAMASLSTGAVRESGSRKGRCT